MEKLKEQKVILIDYKIFNKEDIISLIQLFIKHSCEILDKSKVIRREELKQKGWKESDIKDSDLDTGYSKIEFTSAGNTHYSGTFEDLSDAEAFISNNRITEINLQFWERILDSRFIVRIKHTDARSSSGSSYAEAEGKDAGWVHDTISSAEHFILACRNQSKSFRKSGFIIIPLTVLILNLFLNNFIELISNRMHLFHKMVLTSLTSDWIFVIIILTLFTTLPVIFLYYRVLKLWPRIEIQTGKHYQYAKNDKRNKLLLIISVIIIPTIISFLLRLL